MKNNSGTCGIYKITHKDTGRAYIGLSENIEDRWYRHTHSPSLKHSYIDRAIKKHGGDKFHLEIIEELPNDRDLLMKREAYWVEYYNTYKNDFHTELLKALNSASLPLLAVFPAGEGAARPVLLRDIYSTTDLHLALRQAKIPHKRMVEMLNPVKLLSDSKE